MSKHALCYFRKYGCKGPKNTESLSEHNKKMVDFHRQLVNFEIQNLKEEDKVSIKKISPDKKI